MSYPLLPVTCTPDEFSDMDSDEISFSYTWFVDDEVQSETTSVYDGILPAGSTLTVKSKQVTKKMSAI